MCCQEAKQSHDKSMCTCPSREPSWNPSWYTAPAVRPSDPYTDSSPSCQITPAFGPAQLVLSCLRGALTTLQNCRQTNHCCFHIPELCGVLFCGTIPLEPDASANTDALLFLTKGFLAPSHWPETLAFLLILLSGIFWLVNYCFTISSSRIANFKPKAINSSKNKNGVSGGGCAWAHWFVLISKPYFITTDSKHTHTCTPWSLSIECQLRFVLLALVYNHITSVIWKCLH